MSHANRSPVGATLSALAVVAWLAPGAAAARDDDSEASASDEAPVARSGQTLADRIPAVTGRTFRKEGRVELVPQFGLSLNDPFFRQYLIGAGVSYFVLESLSVGASGEAYLGVKTPVRTTGGASLAPPKYNRAQFAARLDVAWAPIYGKLSLLAEKVLHFDTYVAGGLGVVGASEGSPGFAGSVAIGQRYALSNSMTVRVEVRDQFFPFARNPKVEPKKQAESLLTAMVGVSFLFPADEPTGKVQ